MAEALRERLATEAQVFRDEYGCGGHVDAEGARSLAELLTAAADEIERLQLFERYCGKATEAFVEDAIAHKKKHGKYPFED